VIAASTIKPASAPVKKNKGGRPCQPLFMQTLAMERKRQYAALYRQTHRTKALEATKRYKAKKTLHQRNTFPIYLFKQSINPKPLFK